MESRRPPTDEESGPHPLEYRAARVPSGEQSPLPLRMWVAWTAVALGWLPFACGVISSRAVARSGVVEIVTNHLHAGVAFMVIGMAMSATSCALFARFANWSAVIVAGTSLVVQGCLLMCVGVG